MTKNAIFLILSCSLQYKILALSLMNVMKNKGVGFTSTMVVKTGVIE